jgi:hypothetical protein
MCIYTIYIFEVLTAVTAKSNIFGDVTPFSMVEVCRRFGGSVLPLSAV